MGKKEIKNEKLGPCHILYTKINSRTTESLNGKTLKPVGKKFREYTHDKWGKNFLKKTRQTWQIQTIRAQTDVKSHQNLKLLHQKTAKTKLKEAALWEWVFVLQKTNQCLTFI